MAKCPEGKAQFNPGCISNWIQEDIKVLILRRKQLSHGWRATERDVSEDLLAYALRHFDRATGWPKTARVVQVLAYAAGVTLPEFEWNLYKNHAELYRAMDRSPYPHWMDDPEMRNLHVNPALKNLLGLPDAEFLGSKWLEQIHPEDRDQVIQTTLAGFETRQSFLVRYRIRQRNGHYASIFDYLQPWFPNGSYMGYIGAMHLVHEGSQVLAPEEHGCATPLWLEPGSGKTSALANLMIYRI